MVKQAVEVLVLCFYCSVYVFHSELIFEHSVSSVGNLHFSQSLSSSTLLKFKLQLLHSSHSFFKNRRV